MFFFVKYSLKNGISPLVNVIKHVPGETEEDIQECINNLHFLRFFYNNSIVSFFHTYVSLVLSSMSKYYTEMPEDERKKYDADDFTYLLPDDFSNNEDRFHLFRFKRNTPINDREWNKLIEIEDYYKTNKFSYKVQENAGIYYYTEYCNDEEIVNTVFGEPEYAYLLKTTEEKIYSFDDLFTEMGQAYAEITEDRLKEILSNLKDSYLIYCNDEFSNIVSIIELKN